MNLFLQLFSMKTFKANFTAAKGPVEEKISLKLIFGNISPNGMFLQVLCTEQHWQ